MSATESKKFLKQKSSYISNGNKAFHHHHHHHHHRFTSVVHTKARVRRYQQLTCSIKTYPAHLPFLTHTLSCLPSHTPSMSFYASLSLHHLPPQNFCT